MSDNLDPALSALECLLKGSRMTLARLMMILPEKMSLLSVVISRWGDETAFWESEIVGGRASCHLLQVSAVRTLKRCLKEETTRHNPGQN
jgi:hypothetical protein